MSCRVWVGPAEVVAADPRSRPDGAVELDLGDPRAALAAVATPALWGGRRRFLVRDVTGVAAEVLARLAAADADVVIWAGSLTGDQRRALVGAGATLEEVAGGPGRLVERAAGQGMALDRDQAVRLAAAGWSRAVQIVDLLAACGIARPGDALVDALAGGGGGEVRAFELVRAVEAGDVDAAVQRAAALDPILVTAVLARTLADAYLVGAARLARRLGARRCAQALSEALTLSDLAKVDRAGGRMRCEAFVARLAAAVGAVGAAGGR